MRTSLWALFIALPLWASPSPEVPGIDVRDLGPAWGDTTAKLQRGDIPDTASGRIGTWQARPPAEQIEADEVLLGLGEGAIFVPAMTHGRLEPRVTILDGKEHIVALGASGSRLRVPPGSYVVSFGSGSEDQRLSVPITVREGETAITPVPWSGLTITTISPERQYIRGEYKLVRLDKFQTYGEGFGQTDDRISDISTWIVPPGIYKITGLGSGTDDLTNFVTVRVLPGEWVEYTLVMDADKVVGGGMLAQIPTSSQRDAWRFGADLGGSVAWTREKLSRETNLRTTTNLTEYSELRARKEKDAWLTSARLQYVGGATQVASDNWRIAPDEISAQIFTVRRVTPRVGPYGRIVGTSHLFPTDVDLSSATSPLRLYARNPTTGNLERQSEGGTSWEAASLFAPLELRQGLGLNVEAVQLPALGISLQAGLASRQVFPFGAYYQKSLLNPALQDELHRIDSTADITNAVVMEQAVFEHGTGVEATGELTARLGSSASLTASPGMFWSLWPNDQLEFSMASVLSLHLTRFLSADYRFAIKRSLDEGAIHRFPYSHQVLLRYSFGS